MIVQSDVYQTYQYAKDNLENDDEAHFTLSSILKSKDQYDDVMRFGKYHPDYKEL